MEINIMTEFTNAVEKQKGLQAYEEWAKQIKSYEGDCWKGTRTKIYNDGRKEVYDMKTNVLIEGEPRKTRRRDLIDSNAFTKFLHRIGFYHD